LLTVRCGAALAAGSGSRCPVLSGLPHPPGHLGAPCAAHFRDHEGKASYSMFFLRGKTFAITGGHDAAGA
jgi:hypothetical protein